MMENEFPKVYKPNKNCPESFFWTIFLAYFHSTLYTIE
ncbi:hypothetical protein IGK38_002997 [Enterococcus pernyi]